MIGFLVRKAFFDAWDHFLPLVLYNIGFVALVAIPVAVPPAVEGLGVAVQLGIMIAGFLVLFVYLAGVFTAAAAVTDYRSPTWERFVAGIREHGSASLVFGGILLLHGVLVSVAVPFYGSRGSWVGLFALAALFWFSVTWWLAFQFLLPLRTRLGESAGFCLKKAFLLVLDNLGFSIILALGALIIGAVSVLTAFLVFGPAGLAVWYQTGLKLRLMKYDFLAENPEHSRRSIPWDAILVEERERVGTRTWRGFIFPWKE